MALECVCECEHGDPKSGSHSKAVDRDDAEDWRAGIVAHVGRLRCESEVDSACLVVGVGLFHSVCFVRVMRSRHCG